MCRIFKVYHIGFYAWLKEPLSNKAKDDRRLMGSLKQAWLESGCVNGYRKLHDDLRSLGETCSPNKIARLTGLSVIKAHIGYKRKAGLYAGKLGVIAPNHLARDFNVETPDKACVTDITYIRTHEG
jgi:putative transposase